MTLSVPYSFVPGTKAKADEVNANFIAVLDKIEETDTAKANVDLSNLDSTGQSVMNSKADKTELDGNWTSILVNLASALTINKETTSLQFDLSGYLPDDEDIYEILLTGRCVTANKSGAYLAMLVKTDLFPNNMYICNARTRDSLNLTGAGSVLLPIGKERILYLNRTNEYEGVFYLNLDGYRKVR